MPAKSNAASAALRNPAIPADGDRRVRASVENRLSICFSFDVAMAEPCSRFEGSLRSLACVRLVPGRTKSWIKREQDLGRSCEIYGRLGQEMSKGGQCGQAVSSIYVFRHNAPPSAYQALIGPTGGVPWVWNDSIVFSPH